MNPLLHSFTPSNAKLRTGHEEEYDNTGFYSAQVTLTPHATLHMCKPIPKQKLDDVQHNVVQNHKISADKAGIYICRETHRMMPFGQTLHGHLHSAPSSAFVTQFHCFWLCRRSFDFSISPWNSVCTSVPLERFHQQTKSLKAGRKGLLAFHGLCMDSWLRDPDWKIGSYLFVMYHFVNGSKQSKKRS